MYMVLNPSTGFVSLQYYMTFSDFFETVSYVWYITDLHKTWQHLAGQIDLTDVEPGIACEIITATNSLDQNDYTEQDPIFSTKEYEEERELIDNPTLLSEQPASVLVLEPQDAIPA